MIKNPITTNPSNLNSSLTSCEGAAFVKKPKNREGFEFVECLDLVKKLRFGFGSEFRYFSGEDELVLTFALFADPLFISI